MEGLERNLLAILSNFRKSNPGVLGIVISTYDGLPIVCDPREKGESLCAMAAAVCNAGVNLGARMGMKSFRSAIIETDMGTFLVSGSDDVVILVSLMNKEVAVTKKLPSLLLEIKEALGAE